MNGLRRPARFLGASTAATALFLGLVGVGCAPGWDVVKLSTGIYPNFEYAVPDYVNRCDPNTPTSVSVSAPGGTTISVDGQPAQSGSFTTQVDQQVNEAFTIVVTGPETTSTHHVRCLPLDFPDWRSFGSRAAAPDFYATVLVEDFFSPNVPVVFDRNGVPVWWTERTSTFLLAPLANENLAITDTGGGMTEHRLDGSVALTLDTVGAPSDFHDVLLLPNGNYMMATLETRPCDLSPWGAAPDSRCVFHTFQELTPGGEVAWEWKAESDIPLDETTATWRSERGFFGEADPWHYNSVEWTGDGIIVSFRHMDAVYKIDYATKDVVWKLGGSSTPQRLQILGDPIGSFSGQHDARLLPDGEVSLYDNQSRTGRAPRAVVYAIDPAGGTATLTTEVSDPIAPASFCCGSTRVLPGGEVVTGWGGTPYFTVNRADGSQVFGVGANFLYRSVPIMPGVYTRDELRAGMDAQYDDGVFAHGTTAVVANERLDAVDVAARLGLT